MITAGASLEDNWGVNVRSTVSHKCPLVLISQVNQTLSLASELGDGTAGREGHQDNKVQRPEGSSGMSMVANREGCLGIPVNSPQ